MFVLNLALTKDQTGPGLAGKSIPSLAFPTHSNLGAGYERRIILLLLLLLRACLLLISDDSVAE